MAVPAVRTWRLKKPRAGVRFSGSPESLDRYAFQSLRGVEDAVGSVVGRDIIEYGPGDTLSAGLALLAAGARSYVAVDRFAPDYTSAEAKRWYLGIRDRWEMAFPDRSWPDDLDPTRFPEAYQDRITTWDDPIESFRGTERFDLVTSWQVGEHVLDIQTFADQTARLLRPDGVAVHRVDFGPHAWQRYDDPLYFLRFPEVVWRAMGSERGVPNRRRHHEFMRAWVAAGLRVDCQNQRYFEPSHIAFEKLGPAFAPMPRESLLVQDVVYVCRHRGAAH